MNNKKRALIHFSITAVLITLGILGMLKLKASKPPMKKSAPTASITVVRTITVKTFSQSVIISGEGTVYPLQEINMVPQVDGKVIYIAPSLINGGSFKKSDILLEIEPADYQLAVTLAEARVKGSESNLKIIKEEAAAAQEEWRLHFVDKSKIKGDPPPLVAKEPQMAAVQAKLAADRANLSQAILNLERTKLKAPFNGRVSQENVDVGQYVSPGQSLAALYSTETAEIILPLEDEDIFWFHVPGFTPGNYPGSYAKVRSRIAGREMIWSGQVVRSEGKLDERTRMVNVVIRVKNPYSTKPPLAAGLFVTVDIKGRTLFNSALIPRPALRQGDIVWVVKNENKISFRKVEVARIQGDKALIKSGLKDGEAVVVSPLKAVSEGMVVRVSLAEEEGRP